MKSIFIFCLRFVPAAAIGALLASVGVTVNDYAFYGWFIAFFIALEIRDFSILRSARNES